MKIDRLIAIILLLLERDRISASKLAEMFEVTTRTIYRDIETITLAGIPIVTYPGVNGGIGILERYKLDKGFFSINDISTLLMGLDMVSTTLSSSELTATLARIKSLIPEKHHKEIELKAGQISIDLEPWMGNRALQENLKMIKEGLNRKRVLSFQYRDRAGNLSSRAIEPYQLFLKESSWYLHAYCIKRGDFRVFKLFRMRELEVTGTTFTPREFTPKPFDGEGWINHKLLTVKLSIDNSLSEWFIERFGEECITSTGGSSSIVDFPFTEDDYGYNSLLQFGNKCECLAPERVRNELIRRIDELRELYAKARDTSPEL